MNRKSQKTTPFPTPDSRRLMLWLVTIGVLAVLYLLWRSGHLASLMRLLRDQQTIRQELQAYGAWGPLLLGVLQLVQVFVVVIPGHPFLIAAGYVYGFLAGSLLNLVYVVIASQLVFMIARWTGLPLARRIVDLDRLDRWHSVAEKRGFAFFALAFFLPLIPSDPMNLVGGLSGISGRRFLAASLLGRAPGVVMLTLVGSHGLTLPVYYWALLALTGAGLFLIARHGLVMFARRRATRRVILSGSWFRPGRDQEGFASSPIWDMLFSTFYSQPFEGVCQHSGMPPAKNQERRRSPDQ